MLGILGQKASMSQVFKEDGKCIPVTSIIAGPCYVVQIKEKDKEGYSAVQLGLLDKKEKRTTRALAGHFKKANVTAKKFVREMRIKGDEKVEIGQAIDLDMFKEGDFVDVSGMSIGKGFQGGMRRYGWSGGPRTHGGMNHRGPGSVGTNTTPGRILRGHGLPGHMGHRRTTVQSLEIIKVDKENNILMVKGAVPGHKGTYLEVRKAKKK
ncbi:MAG: 50S ribosomal protein L3 [Candidatus Omnitrophota bacterium]